MPYTEQEARERAWNRFHKHHTILNPGDLAYLISQLIDCYLSSGHEGFKALADVDGVLGLSQHEFRRRIVGPYEDRKREENGEVYTVLG